MFLVATVLFKLYDHRDLSNGGEQPSSPHSIEKSNERVVNYSKNVKLTLNYLRGHAQ